MFALFAALIFPVAMMLALGAMAMMLQSHGRRMIDALLMRPHGAPTPGFFVYPAAPRHRPARGWASCGVAATRRRRAA